MWRRAPSGHSASARSDASVFEHILVFRHRMSQTRLSMPRIYGQVHAALPTASLLARVGHHGTAYTLVRVPVYSRIPADTCRSDLTTEFSITSLIRRSCPPSPQWRTTSPGDQENSSFILSHSPRKRVLKLLNPNYSQLQT